MALIGHFNVAIAEESLHPTPAVADHQMSDFHAVKREFSVVNCFTQSFADFMWGSI